MDVLLEKNGGACAIEKIQREARFCRLHWNELRRDPLQFPELNVDTVGAQSEASSNKSSDSGGAVCSKKFQAWHPKSFSVPVILLAFLLVFTLLCASGLAAQIAAPLVKSPNGFQARQTFLTLTCPTPDTEIHYSTNGLEPTRNDPMPAAGGLVSISHSLTLQVKAYPIVGKSSESLAPSETVAVICPAAVVAAGANDTLSVTSSGVPYGWGNNANARLGVGDLSPRYVPTPIMASNALTLKGIADIDGSFEDVLGNGHTVAASADGSVWTWGANNVGQLGNGASSPVTKYYAVKVMSSSLAPISGIVAVAAGDSFSIGLDGVGNVWAWGNGNVGQLGDGSVAVHSRASADLVRVSPTQVLGNIVSIAAGNSHALALDSNGNVWAWGLNSAGQLGQNNFTSSGYAMLVKKDSSLAPLSGVTSIAAGLNCSVAVLRDGLTNGAVRGWGDAAYGSLGNGTFATTSNPQTLPVPMLAAAGISLTGVDRVRLAKSTAATSHTLILKTNGELWACGANATGQLGDNTFTPRPYPAPVLTNGGIPLRGVVDMAAGATHSVALTATGVMLTWGNNNSGQLGINSTAQSSIAFNNSVTMPRLANAPPSISISASGLPFTAPAVVTLSATTSDLDGTVQRVDFLSNGTLLASVASAPWSIVWKDAPAGTYSITAIATDNAGSSQYSTPIAVVVNTPLQFVSGSRFVRGGSTNLDGASYEFLSFVLPIDFEGGLGLDAMGNNSRIYGTVLPWLMRVAKSTGYHINVSGGAVSYPYTNPDGRFENPIVAFGGVSGKALYSNKNYTFGLSSGSGSTSKLRLRWWSKARLAAGQTNVDSDTVGFELSLPQKGTSEWDVFSKNDYTQVISSAVVPGLETTVRYVDGATVYDKWGTASGVPLLITHKCTNPDYYYEIDFKGKTWLPGQSNSAGYWMAVNNPANPGDATAAYSLGYTLEFQTLPPWRSTYVEGPHFNGKPMPSTYIGKTVEELLHANPPIARQFPNPQAAFLALDNSPELRVHPLLDKFVADMGADPMALVNYVLNEIEITDAMSYNDQGGLEETSINLGGVNRGALATFLEGQGSPSEQCALLVYLLRKAGVPAGYVFPAHNAMTLLDGQMSKLVRMQLHNAVSAANNSNVPHLLPVNYPWVTAYIAAEGRWVHIFPWLKDTDLKEGRNLYDYLPDGYNSGPKWLRKYLQKDPSVFSVGNGKDTLAALFQPHIEKLLRTTRPDVSLGDLGTLVYDRRNFFNRWDDLPRPWAVDEKIGEMKLVSTIDALDSVTFDTVTLTVYKDTNGNGSVDAGEPAVIDTGSLRACDLHNRRLVLSAGTPSNGAVQISLTLAPFVAPVPGAVVPTAAFNDDVTLLNRQVLTANLSATDDALLFKITYNRHRKLGALTAPNGVFLDLCDSQQVVDTRPVRKGDLAAVCLNFGRVTRSMLNVHANEFWSHQQYLQANPTAVGNSDVFLGGSAYLMGMAYYERVSRFQCFAAPLHKVTILGFHAHGFAKISPARQANGQFQLDASGQLIYSKPNVDMSFQRLAWAGNGTLRPDSGLPETQSGGDFYPLLIGQISSAEHEAIDSFFQKLGSVSTVKLLHLAQLGSGKMVELSKSNYQAVGLTSYTPPGSATAKPLREWAGYQAANPTAGCLWKTIVDGFTASFGDYQQVLMTPGPVTTGSYTGMGALIMNPNGYGALIATSQNGGYANYSLPATSLSVPNYYKLTLDFPQSSGGDSIPKLGSSELNSGTTSLLFPIVNESLYNSQAGQLRSGAAQVSSYISNAASTGSAAVSLSTSLSITDQILNLANSGMVASSYDSSGTVQQTPTSQFSFAKMVYDPVNAMTGEFYHDECDLRLNGPMPLEIRRNYSSMNLADGDFGFGWKMAYVPYLILSQDAGQSLIYASESDGSVFAYHRQKDAANNWTNTWIPTVADNPHMGNQRGDTAGSLLNPFNGKIVKSTNNSGTTVYTLTGGDAFQRVFRVRSYPIGGVSRERPYLDSWTDNRGILGLIGNSYSFRFCGDDAGENNTTVGYGHIKTITASNGSFLRFVYDSYGHIIEVYSSDGSRLRYFYDEQGDLVKVIRPDASEVRYEYLYGSQTVGGVATPYSQHLVIREIKPDGRLLENDYDNATNGRRVIEQRATVGPNNELATNAKFTYRTTVDAADKTIGGYTEVRDAYGQLTRYDFLKSKLVKVTDPLNFTEIQEWYSAADVTAGISGAYQSSLKRRTDKRGLVSEFLYDPRGNVVQRTVKGDVTGDGLPDVALSSFTYNSQNLPVRASDPSGNYTAYTYGDASHPMLPTLVEKYTSGGVLVTSTANNYENVVSGLLSSYGLPKATSVAAGTPDVSTTVWSNNANGFITAESRATGTIDPPVTRTLRYNLRGKLVAEMDATNRITAYAYDSLGNRTWQERRDSSGALVSWQYDYFNRNGESEWYDGPRYNPEDYVLRRYDGAGRKKEEIRWRTEAVGDGSGVQSASLPDEALATTIYRHDLFGNLIEVLDARHNSTEMTYDAIGQMLSRKFHNGDKTAPVLAQESWTYEAGGQVASYTDPLGAVTRKFYTGVGQLRRQENPDGTVLEWLYQVDGRLSKEVFANKSYRLILYNDATRTLTRQVFSSGGTILSTETVVYDRRGNVVSRTDAEGQIVQTTYDALNRVKTVTGPGATSGSAQQISATFYDAAGVVTLVRNALGEVTRTTVDALGRPILVEVIGTDNTLVRRVAKVYSPDGHSVAETSGTGAGATVTTTFSDTDGHPVLVRTADNTFSGFVYDNLGNVVSKRDEIGAFTFLTYDALNRQQTERLEGGATTVFSYDAAGNLLKRQIGYPETPSEKQGELTCMVTLKIAQ